MSLRRVLRGFIFVVLSCSIIIIAKMKIYDTFSPVVKQKLPGAVLGRDGTNTHTSHSGEKPAAEETLARKKPTKMLLSGVKNMNISHQSVSKTPISKIKTESNDQSQETQNQSKFYQKQGRQNSFIEKKDSNAFKEAMLKIQNSKMIDSSDIQTDQSDLSSESNSIAEDRQFIHSNLFDAKIQRKQRRKHYITENKLYVDVVAKQLERFENVKRNISKTTIYLTSKKKNGSTSLKKKYGNFSSECKDLESPFQDLFCMNKLTFLEDLKNPCWYEGTSPKRTQLRCLPYFFLLGCGKCASTDLYARLTKHPHIFKNKGFLEKEALYWSWKKYGYTNFEITYAQSFEWYASQFDLLAENLTKLIPQNSRFVNKFIIGDSSPPDFWDFRGWPLLPQNFGLEEPKIFTPQLIQYILRNPKFILLLRNPTERLFSDYFFLKQGKSVESFHDAVISAITVLTQCLSMHTQRHCFFSSDLFTKLKCRVHYGCYSVYLKEWLSSFNIEQFYFARTEDYSADVDEHLEQIFEFLGVDKLSQFKLDKIESEKRKRITRNKKSNMLLKTRKILDKFYEKYNQELVLLLGNKKYLWSEESLLYERNMRRSNA